MVLLATKGVAGAISSLGRKGKHGPLLVLAFIYRHADVSGRVKRDTYFFIGSVSATVPVTLHLSTNIPLFMLPDWCQNVKQQEV
jgi:hypothetical protein